jgi:hypothetical protein
MKKIMVTSEMIEKLNDELRERYDEFSDSDSDSDSEVCNIVKKDEKRYAEPRERYAEPRYAYAEDKDKRNVIDLSIPNYFSNLPDDIQHHIWKTYYSNNVLNEMKNIKKDAYLFWRYNWNSEYYFPVCFRWYLIDYRCYSCSHIDYDGNDITDKFLPSGQYKVYFEYYKMYEEFYEEAELEHLRDVYGSDYGTSAYYHDEEEEMIAYNLEHMNIN